MFLNLCFESQANMFSRLVWLWLQDTCGDVRKRSGLVVVALWIGASAGWIASLGWVMGFGMGWGSNISFYSHPEN